MVRSKTYLLIFIYITITINSISVLGNNDYLFKHYNTDNGLSQNTVRSIFQDNFGFMWFGTKDGLNRFDGSNFKLFKLSTEGELSDNVFHRILQDKNDNIWVSTEDGVYIYDYYHEKFQRFNHITNDNDSVYGIVSEMILDADGDIWMSVEGKGIFHYSFVNDQLFFYSIPIVEDGMKMVSLCADNNNGVWVFPYSSPILHIDKVAKSVSQFNLEDEEFLYNTGEIQTAFSDQNNILIIGTSQKGLVSINTINKTHKILLDKDSYGEPIFVRTIEKVNPTTLWIGTESGIYIYDRITEKTVNIRHNPSIPNSLSDNAIYSIYQDKDGGIWIGSFFGGVDYYSNLYNNFELFFPIVNEQSLQGKRVREIIKSSNENLWIGTEDGGLNLFDPETKKFLSLPMPLTSLYTNIHALLQDGDILWISTYTKGLNRYNLKTGELTTYTSSDQSNSISQNSTFALCKDQQGMLWIGTLAGVDIYDEELDRFTTIEEFKGKSITDIFEDSKGFIWISTFLDGLYRYNPASDEWKIYIHDSADSGSLPSNKPVSIYEDSQRRLWVTTQGGGFGLYNYDREEFKIYNNNNGLPNDVVYQIVEDQEGYLWLSTNQGLVKFDPQKEFFVNYTVDNGLKTNQFNYKSSFKDSNGIIYFGSIDGFIRFNPATFVVSESNSELVFTELYINNVKVRPGVNRSPLKRSIMVADEIKLPHHQNSLTLQYAHLDYSPFNNDMVYYKLVGFDNDWIKSSDNQNIVYANLKPGKYNLLLGKAEQGSNDPIEAVNNISVVISPPIWLNGWAYLLYTILLITGLFFIFRFLRLREEIRRKERMRDFEQEKERELYRSKISFFTNVAHEIRTPLTLIKAPLDHILMSDNNTDHVNDSLQIMRKNTDRLLDLTNQLLDFRKTESESYLLDLKIHNATELIKESKLRFSPLATQKGIEFEFILPEKDLMIQVDKDAFLKILSNLINNGIKYSETFLRVKAYLNDDNNEFHLITENDGSLIPDGFNEEIFKPFVQIEANEQKNGTGTGIGLALASSLSHLHNGSLKLLNDPELNRFHLILPIGQVDKSIDVSAEKTTKEINLVSEVSDSDKKATILLVDDDIELLQFESKFLSKHYRVLIAENGNEALNVLKNSTANLIVSDVMMPEMDGFEFTQKVKSNIEFSHIPVILLTAKVTEQSKVQGYELGADAYIEKPFSIEVLLARIENLLQGRKNLRETFNKNPFIGATSVALTKSDEKFIKKLNRLVQDNISESEFNVENMAEHFNMSRASFYRKVKGVLDLTPNEYLRVERLKKAAQLLKESDNKVNEVCYMVGFNSPSYFAKCFQQQFGVLPKDFQEQR